MKIGIKHMVCDRCVSAVAELARSAGLPLAAVELGAVTLSEKPQRAQLEAFAQALEERGFALVESEKAGLVNKIKTLIIQRIHHGQGDASLKLSAYLSQELHYDYSHLSKLFSSVESITIERFATLQRIERAKELLTYQEMSIADIAERLDYSSPAHLSAQFKQATGMTPSQFKKLQSPGRRTLDSF